MNITLKPLVALLMSMLILTFNLCYAQAPLKKPIKKDHNTEQNTQNKVQKKTKQKSIKSSKHQVTPKSQQKNNPKISQPDGYINGYGYVDLGLPSGIKWGICNIGATHVDDYGNYYAWGEINSKSIYTQDNSNTYGKDNSWLHSNGYIDSEGNLTQAYDAAYQNWGKSWRMPTKSECEELKDNCSWIWTSIEGHKGFKVTGPNGNSIFIPASGYRNETSLINSDVYCYFWSASVTDYTYYAYYLYFFENGQDVDWGRRYSGRSIRPITE